MIAEDNKERKKRPVFDVDTSYARGGYGTWSRRESSASLRAEGNQVEVYGKREPSYRKQEEEFQNGKARRRGESGGFE